MEDDFLKIIIKQNYMNMYLLQQILVEMGMNKKTLKELQRESQKEANKCVKELFNEK